MVACLLFKYGRIHQYASSAWLMVAQDILSAAIKYLSSRLLITLGLNLSNSVKIKN